MNSLDTNLKYIQLAERKKLGFYPWVKHMGLTCSGSSLRIIELPLHLVLSLNKDLRHLIDPVNGLPVLPGGCHCSPIGGFPTF
jgi:hypothetical protein